jgi:hypothetical protein
MKIVTRRKKRWLRRSVPGVLRQETPLSQQRNGTFTDVGQWAGVAGSGKAWGTGCAFVDYGRDGHLDLRVANQVDPRTLCWQAASWRILFRGDQRQEKFLQPLAFR